MINGVDQIIGAWTKKALSLGDNVGHFFFIDGASLAQMVAADHKANCLDGVTVFVAAL